MDQRKLYHELVYVREPYRTPVYEREPYHNPIDGTTSPDLPSESLPSPPLYMFPKLAFDPTIDGSEATWGVDDELGVMANVQAYFEVAHRVSFLL